MLTVLKKCFASKLPEWEEKLKQIIPSYGQKLADNPALCAQLFDKTTSVLGLKEA